MSLKMTNYSFALPTLEGFVEFVKNFSQENSYMKEHDEFYHIAAIIREQVNIFKENLEEKI